MILERFAMRYVTPEMMIEPCRVEHALADSPRGETGRMAIVIFASRLRKYSDNRLRVQ
jgi:hypothetical protein